MPTLTTESVTKMHLKLADLSDRKDHMIALQQSDHSLTGEYEVLTPEQISENIAKINTEINHAKIELNATDQIEGLKFREAHLVALLESKYWADGEHEGDNVRTTGQISRELNKIQRKLRMLAM